MKKLRGWSTMVSGTRFPVRCRPRKKKGKKPSLDSLYECIFFDRIFTRKRVKRASDLWALDVLCEKENSCTSVPEYIVLHSQLPLSRPKMIGQNIDGPSIQTCAVFKLRKETSEVLNTLEPPTWSSALRLFVMWSKRAPRDSKWKGRLKLIMFAENPIEAGMPKMFKRYNGKPILLTKSTELFAEKNYFEISTNFAKFCYLFRQAWSTYAIPALKKGDVSVGITIEGRNDSELPEQILGCFSCHYLGLPEGCAE
jgi:hypothetical protein